MRALGNYRSWHYAWALAGEPITIQGTGSQGRQFTHARDIGRGFAAALTRGTIGAAYNLVADEMVTIRALAELVAALAPTPITYGEARAGEVPTALVSSERAKRELGWRAPTELRTGVEEIVAEHRAELERIPR